MSTKQITNKSTKSNDFQLLVEVGDVFSEVGLTRVKLDGNGRLLVEQQRDKEISEPFYGELDLESTKNIFGQVSQFNWEQRFPTRLGIPDEAIVQWILHDENGGTVTLRVWLRDAEKLSPMATVLTILRKSVEQMTDGKLYL